MKRSRLLSAFALILLLALAASCGTARRGEPLTGPHTLDDPVLVAGERAFNTYCAQCHPGGTAGVGFALNNKPLPGFAIRLQVRHGLGAMPAFPEKVISDEELDAIVAYLHWLRRIPPAQAARKP
jgi:mono/diheme cytochrome c family protein